MIRLSRYSGGFAGAAFLLAGCATTFPTSDVFPQEAAPGSSVTVRVPPTAPEELEVRVANRPAPIVRVVPGAGVEFLVPAIRHGSTQVVVRSGQKVIATTSLTVLQPTARQLVLKMEGNRIELLTEAPAAGLDRQTLEAPLGTGLSYDVLTPSGALVVTGVLPHPILGRREVHEAGGKLHGLPPPATATFPMRVPAVPSGSTVRFYEYAVGIDLATPGGRSQRRFLSEVILKKGPAP